MATRKWGAEKLVNTTTANDQLLSDVTVLVGGSFVVVWQDDSGADSAIRAQRYDALGNRLGGEIAIVVSAGNDHELPSVTALADGGFYVTWTQLLGADNFIQGSVYNASGAFVRSQPVIFALGEDNDSQVTRFGIGSAVAWLDPDAFDINFRIFDAAGNGGAVLTANSSTSGPSSAPQPRRRRTGQLSPSSGSTITTPRSRDGCSMPPATSSRRSSASMPLPHRWVCSIRSSPG